MCDSCSRNIYATFFIAVISPHVFWPDINYVVNSQSLHGSLPSGMQKEDMWKDLYYTNACDSSSMKDSAATGAPSSPRFEAKDKQAEVGDTVTVRVPMPDAWLHTFILVFACSGHFADHPDPGLDLSLSDGPLDEKIGQDAN